MITPLSQDEQTAIFAELYAFEQRNKRQPGEFTLNEYMEYVLGRGEELTREALRGRINRLVQVGIVKSRKVPNRRVYYRWVGEGESEA